MLTAELDIHRELVEQARQGKREAYTQLYRLYSKGMFNICLRMISDRQEAEDILQDSFADAFKRLKDFRFESTFGAWLKQIVVNKCISAYRKHPIADQFFENDEFPDIPDTDDGRPDEYELQLKVEKVKQAMANLPEGSRNIFSLYLFEGYDHTEIAEIMGISESTSKTQFMRARNKVKSLLISMGYETR